MDQIFDRLERLVKAWVNTTVETTSSRVGSGSRGSERRSFSGDSDLDAAMAELDDFLDTSKTETERKEEEARKAAEQAQRLREEQARRGGGYGNTHGSFQQAPDTKKVVEDAYRYLGCAAYAPFADVKTAYKKLLFKFHPDRNASTPDQLKSATETSSRINAAYQIIEAYEQSKQAR